MPAILTEALLTVAVAESNTVSLIQAEQVVMPAVLVTEYDSIKVIPVVRGKQDLKSVVFPERIAVA